MSSSQDSTASPAVEGSAQTWTFLSNYAHVLICLAADPGQRLRDVATQVGITERAVQKIIDDMEEEGLLQRERVGRRNQYQLLLDQPLRHPLEAHRNVRELIELVARPAPTRSPH